MPEPLLKLRGVQKGYGSLRPLRIQELDIHSGERLALLGLDAIAAEVFVNLTTGAVLPDEGEVWSFGMRRPAHELPAEQRARVRLARALALDPSLLILEHATASMTDGAASDYGRDIATLAQARTLAVVALTASERFGRALDSHLLVQHPATGVLTPRGTRLWNR